MTKAKAELPLPMTSNEGGTERVIAKTWLKQDKQRRFINQLNIILIIIGILPFY